MAIDVPSLKEAVSLPLGQDPEAVPGRVWARARATAEALVERHAPDAPEAIRDEAVVRAAGWLIGADPAITRRGVEAGNLKVDLQRAGLSALRHSGAMALLSPWKARRAGRIAEAD